MESGRVIVLFFDTEHLLSRPHRNSRWQQKGTEFKGTATGGASDGLPGFEVSVGQGHIEAIGQFDQSADVIERNRTIGIHETIVTDFHEAGGQDVL